MATVHRPECLDFLQFQDILKKMRDIDDKIIYALNVHLPTESFKGSHSDATGSCKELFSQLETNYSKREEAIKNCISFSNERINELKAKRERDSNDVLVSRELRKEQTKLRLLQTELGVEEVVKDRTTKVYYERCRPYYVPPNLGL